MDEPDGRLGPIGARIAVPLDMLVPAPTSEESEVGRRPLQFGLRTMFAVVACLGALFGVMGMVGPVWSTILVWFLLLALAHVIANCWGSRGWRTAAVEGSDEVDGTATVLTKHDSRPAADAPPTLLRDSTRLGWKMPLATVAGAIAAGALGTVFLAWLGIGRVGLAGIAVGGFSSAVVGGFFGFLTSSFLEVAGGAWQQAAKGARADRK
ncbi:MAG TPA: hypothetical protein VGN42_00855 [Pirellulales bacterium]|jgi:hypothetical protein|nr:hypothetical protein [Pirellulales bacterium]